MSLLVALCYLRHRGRWRPLTRQADMIWRTKPAGLGANDRFLDLPARPLNYYNVTIFVNKAAYGRGNE